MLRPEEVVSLDLGSDGIGCWTARCSRAKHHNIVVYNPWVEPKALLCNCALPGLEATQQTFSSQVLNGAQQYAQGIEFTVANEPKLGVGYRLNTSFERNYYLYNPQSFFASGQTFFNGQQFQSSGSTTTSVPYMKAYGEVQFAGARDFLVRAGVDFEGSNNAYNAPPFFMFDAGLQANTGFHHVMLGVAAENITNVNWGALYARGVAFQGLPPVTATAIPGSNGGYTYSSSTYTVGLVAPPPVTYRFTLTLKL